MDTAGGGEVLGLTSTQLNPREVRRGGRAAVIAAQTVTLKVERIRCSQKVGLPGGLGGLRPPPPHSVQLLGTVISWSMFTVRSKKGRGLW